MGEASDIFWVVIVSGDGGFVEENSVGVCLDKTVSFACWFVPVI